MGAEGAGKEITRKQSKRKERKAVKRREKTAGSEQEELGEGLRRFPLSQVLPPATGREKRKKRKRIRKQRDQGDASINWGE